MSPKSADPRHDFSCQLLQKGEEQLHLHQQAKLFAYMHQHRRTSSTCENRVHGLPAKMVHVAFWHLVPVQHNLQLVLACACVLALTLIVRSPLCLQQQLLPKTQRPSAQRASTAIMFQFTMCLATAKEQLVTLQHLCAFEWAWAWDTLVCHYGTIVISSSVPSEPFRLQDRS